MSSLTRRGLFTAATALSVSACASTPPAPTTTPTVGWTSDGLEIGLRIRRGELTAQEAVGEAIARAQALQPQLIVSDVSVIGLAKALPAALALAAPGADLIALVKPQFEVGRENIGKGGVVKDDDARQRAVAGVAAFLETSGWTVQAHAESPVTGGDGNVEYLVWAKKRPPARVVRGRPLEAD